MSEYCLNQKFITKLLKSVEDTNELKSCIKILNYHVSTTFDKCLEKCLEVKAGVTKTTLLEIESILDYIDDEINIGHWSDIPVELRRTYSVASFVKMILLLKFHKKDINVHRLREVLKCIDRGLLLGAPLENNEEILTKSATLISKNIAKYFGENTFNMVRDTPDGDKEMGNNSNQFSFLFDSIQAIDVDSVVLPSLEHFNNIYFARQQPVKLQGCIDHWPARTKWKNIDYLLGAAGDRTVPIEIGTQYVDENWYQKLMTLREFVERFYSNKEDSIGYLAQHNLFNQIPELVTDICIPEYCSLTQNDDMSCEPDINCWFGPAGTVSSLHNDPKNNLLAQVYGTKQVLLFSPTDSGSLYPHEGTLLSNTSQVDPMMPDLKQYPLFQKATMYKCLLREGEILFIPEKWWHHVIALEKSFSVSFWWQ